jgi:pilus assembly protein CpaB
MLTRQSMIALGIAVVLGIVAVYLANVFLTSSQQRVEAGGTTKIAVATVPMAFGVDVTPEKVRFVDYPNTSIPAGSFKNMNELIPGGKKRFALLPIGVNEPILLSKISAEGQGASIAALLPDGMRAATVRINDVSGVAGFVQPNDTVDVLITHALATSGDSATQATDVLLQNVRVIAIDQEAKNADGTPKVARTATLEVNPLDAQKLALAQQAGSLSLVLRKPGEPNNPVVETISLNDLRYNMYGGARYAGVAPGGLQQAMVGAYGRAGSTVSAANSAPQRPRRSSSVKRSAPAIDRSIEVYRGTKSDQVKVGEHGR